MTWRHIEAWEWVCDGRGCSREVMSADDAEPEGWTHTADGRDLCERCGARAQAGGAA